MARILYFSVLILAVIGLALGASIPPESGAASPTASPSSTVSPSVSMTADGGFMPSIAINPPPAGAVASPSASTPSVVIVPPTMPPAVAKFVSKIKAAKAALTASMAVPVV
ncbi:uncharacterized protein [Macrobrachium rosenbergii]|uniref:uncharacterized protein n=1 Tax=Macrobrachium rosenbergii TaxID=79674 RepID=UPI0034D3E6DC